MKKNIKDKENINLLSKKYNIGYYKIFPIFFNMKSNLKYPNIFVLILFISSYYLYYLSLEKCLDGFDICGKKKKWIFRKVIEAFISYIILSIIIELIIYKIISKFHLVHILIIYTYFYKMSHGLDFHDHGYFNFLCGITIIFIIILAFIPFNLFIYFYKKNKNYTIIYNGFLFILFFYYLHITNTYMNCKDWPKGLNNSYIDNNIYIHGCLIKYPNFCPYKIGKYIFDFTRWKNIKCYEKKKDTKKVLIKFSKSHYINKHTKKIGFPLINKSPKLLLNFDGQMNFLKNFVKENLVDMDNIHLVNKIYKNYKPEYIVDYTKNPFGEIIINLNYNKTLSKERKTLEKNSCPYSKNIIILYIDSVSRANSIRQLQKTLKFFEKFMAFKGGYNKKNPSEKFHSFQFFKYHSFNGYTSVNYPRLFYGNVAGKNIIRITKYFKDNGYVTCYSSDICLRENTVTYHNYSYEEICDHELIICDPNKSNINSQIKRCLYNKITSAHLYDYGNQFWRKYKMNRKLLFITSNDGHEGTLEILKYLDNILYNFLTKLFQDNLLKDTSIFLLSDHGASMPSPYYLIDFYKIELSLPMLYIICNDRKNISYNKQYSFILKNQQILITAYDIYNTIANLIFGDNYELIMNKTGKKDTPKSPLGQSLFNYINSTNRKPQNYKEMVLNICK